jgi:hypothetical protein
VSRSERRQQLEKWHRVLLDVIADGRIDAKSKAKLQLLAEEVPGLVVLLNDERAASPTVVARLIGFVTEVVKAIFGRHDS